MPERNVDTVNKGKAWFENNVLPLEEAYQKGITPWERSGVGLHHPRTEEYWRAVRQPIAHAIGRSGSVLDIGCANGYLLESLQHWLGENGVAIEPFGLDISAALLEEARLRIPDGMFYHANVWGWKAPRRYDFVLTELVYVPEEDQQAYLRGLLSDVVEADGKLIISQYSNDISRESSLAEKYLSSMDYKVEDLFEGRWEGVRKTVVAIVLSRCKVKCHNVQNFLLKSIDFRLFISYICGRLFLPISRLKFSPT